MRGLELFRAIPRPLGQYLAIGLVWPIWLACGLAEAIWPGAAIVRAAIEGGLAAIPDAGWAAITGIIVAGHWSRTRDKQTEVAAAETLVEARRIANEQGVE